MKTLFQFKPAGVQFGEYKKLPTDLEPGAKLNFFWEHKNKYDPNAIRIEYDGIKIGYVPADSDYQKTLHRYREAKIKILATLLSIKRKEPPWNMFTVECRAEKEIEQPKEEQVL